eukprot:TRINITY_DN12450_c0_g1_i2.p1 TRINITY_DN12450_c0_g1~~TRINITY_DN12450_c0_g1_i2.p1  ORF type:complete len:313 (+),score=46.91 TRINITY_DN12450_c0_g1_i2:53-991(+)
MYECIYYNISYMESNSSMARPKKDVKIRPVIIQNLYKNGGHSYKHNQNLPLKSAPQVPKKPAKQSDLSQKRVKKEQIAKAYADVVALNHSEHMQAAFYGNGQNRGRFQVTQNRSGGVFKQVKSSGGNKAYGEANHLELLPPLIVKKVSFQATNQNKQKTTQHLQKDFPGLPRTALFVPFLKDCPAFLPGPTYREETHPNMDTDTLVELSRAEVPKGPRKLVYEIYEVSPYTKNNTDYDSFLAYNSEAALIDASWDLYPLVCTGKGGPTRYFAYKARYQEELVPYYMPESLEDTTLVFESRFESGNLRRAVQM